MAQRGRPRPEATVRRDTAIRAYLEENGPKSRNEIAKELGISTQLTYLALSRLAEAGSVVRSIGDNGENVWRSA